MEQKRYPDFREKLIDWFEKSQRGLPWRRSYSAYQVWISEVMLQQTQVATVLPFFERWMKRFPDIFALAAAPEQEVLKHWEGLGYYSRARNLHKTAHILASDHGGRFPRSHRTILGLPGIGPYTAGALMSIAFNEDFPVVDGNVERVLARLFDIGLPVRSAQGRALLWKTAEDLLPPGRARAFNQALMELGALVCLPRTPGCTECPVKSFCRGFELSTVDQRPVPSVRNRVVRVEAAVGVLVEDGRLLIQKRPPSGLMPHLWEFPGGKLKDGETPAEALEREFREELELSVACLEKIGVIKHSYTSFRVTLHAFLCKLRQAQGTPVLHAAVEARWVTPDQLSDYPFPAANARLIRMIEDRLAASSRPIATKIGCDYSP